MGCLSSGPVMDKQRADAKLWRIFTNDVTMGDVGEIENACVNVKFAYLCFISRCGQKPRMPS